MRLGKFLLLSTLARIPSVLSSTMIGASLRHGDWKMTLLVFLVTAVLGIVGITCKDRVLAFCRREHKGHADKQTP